VLEAALEMGYHWKSRKVEGAHSRMQDIAVLSYVDPEWSLVLFLIRPIIQELDKRPRAAGYNTELVPISRSESTAELLDEIRGSESIGMVSIHFVSSELALFLESEGIPVIVVMNSSFQDRFRSVCVDDFQGASEGTSHLIHAGHLHIRYIDCPPRTCRCSP
jgi:DNA-binding LacI/PurR family transcriptional regulator